MHVAVALSLNVANLRPYDVPRNLDQDAWFLYQTTSLAYYELCAHLCEEFAELYNLFITGHGLRGAARLDYWVSRYLTHAENIRRGIGFIKNGGDYMPMIDFLGAPAADYRGLVEQPMGWMDEEQRKQWDQSFDRMSFACGVGSETLKNNEWAGQYWNERSLHGHEYHLVDRDDSHKGDCGRGILYLTERQLVSPPQSYPRHVVEANVKAEAGEPCPHTGVWVPKQWLDGANDFSLAFCMQGHPMQPAYQILVGKEVNILAEFIPDWEPPQIDGYVGPLETRATDTTWYFVSQPVVQATSPSSLHLRCEGGEACPKSGYWITPAKSGSRHYFQQGTPMPEVVSDCGSTIWQWDNDQSDPKL